MEKLSLTRHRAGRRVASRLVTADTTLTAADEIVLCDATTGPIVANLPTAVSVDGQIFEIIKVDFESNTVTIEPFGTEKVAERSNIVFFGIGEGYRLVSHNGIWYKI